MGSLLGTGPGSLRSWAIWTGGHLWDAWGRLLESVSTGESVRRSITGFEAFDRLEIDAETARVFNEAMAELTRVVADDVAKVCDLSDAKQVVDVGGGYGDLLLAILRANPEVSGIVFDLPHATDGAKRAFEAVGLSSRCEFRAGSFFEDLPPGADAYLLKSVIHDWDDDSAALILRNCRRAMNGMGRLFLIERILPERMSDSPAHRSAARMDLTMLLVHSGRERTEEEFRRLLAATGFDLVRILPASGALSVIEARPTG
jgi:SAM-dependent methyltransferase